MGSGVVQLVEQSLLTPDVRGLNPVIAKFTLNICALSTVPIEKTKMKQREAGMT